MQMVDPPFCLYSSYPRAVILDYSSVVEHVNSESLISVESDGDYDPVLLYGSSQVWEQ